MNYGYRHNQEPLGIVTSYIGSNEKKTILPQVTWFTGAGLAPRIKYAFAFFVCRLTMCVSFPECLCNVFG